MIMIYRQQQQQQRRQQNIRMQSSSTISTALRWCLFTTATLFYATTTTTVSATDDVVPDFTTQSREETEAITAQCENLDYVTGPLYASDEDGNGVLSQEEFVVFTDLVSGGWLSSNGMADNFQDMPLVLQEANVVLTCLCALYSTEPWGQPGCCDNKATSGIRTDGSGPHEKPDEVQLEYLTYVCGTMSETLGRVNAQLVAPPSSAPSDHPSSSPSREPTLEPTLQPSVAPVTASPTVAPSEVPTTGLPTVSPVSGAPTASPVTDSPTASPVTESPTGSPTSDSPTGSPSTLTPTVSPTSSPVTTSPTISPIISPTNSPIISPSMSPIKSPTMSPIEPGSPTRSPTATPSVSSSEAPSLSPSVSPTVSTSPTAAPTAIASSEPSTSFPPTISSVPTLFSGEFPLSINFVQYLDGNVTTVGAIMEGETNQVKVMMEEALLTLANVVIEELNNGNGTRRLGVWKLRKRRELLVKEATNVTVTDVQDVLCPPGLPSNDVTEEEDSCLAWDVTIVLDMINESDPNGQANEIRQKILSKLSAGWLDDDENFDRETALKPPQKPPTQAPTNGPGSVNKVIELKPDPLSNGGKIGIAIAAVGLVLVVALFATQRVKKQNEKESCEFTQDFPSNSKPTDLDPPIPNDDPSVDTETFSYADGAFLLHGHNKSSSGGSQLANVPDESEDDSFYDASGGEDEENVSTHATSNLAAMGAFSTLVAATSQSPRSTSAERKIISSPESTASSDVFGTALGSSPAPSASGNVGAIALGAGAVAAGTYIATKKEESEDEEYIGEIDEPLEKETPMSSSLQMEELDVAIDTGDWGHVGALAAVLASEGKRTPPQGIKSPRSITSGDGASSRSRGTSTNQSMDQARAVEIDKLVEAGDWQGVVLAAARFEADQTMDGESHSATSASRSSRWSGSGRSSASGTQRSFGTTHSSHEAGRSQAEIRAEVEALVRRVVPEEADNVDEMLNQFKGREEELVETLRRMQERAIASRARLAVQKSVKLEAKARARSASVKTIGSQGSSIELEQAIEEGNWLAVGKAAQKISDQNEGGLSLEDKERLRQKISQSPAMNSQAFAAESANLDELIEKGDWSGVIAAAKAASEGASISNAGNISKEEQDALAQASMWQAIANQSKQDGGPESSGAGDAADWAISRSLNALNTPGEMQSRTINDIADEESSDASQYESASYSRSPDYKGSMV